MCELNGIFVRNIINRINFRRDLCPGGTVKADGKTSEELDFI
jgi:hypothetical protein